MKFVTVGICAAFLFGQTGAVAVESRCQIALDTTLQDIEPTCGVHFEGGSKIIYPDPANVTKSLDTLCSSECIVAVSQGVTEMIDQCEGLPTIQGFLKVNYNDMTFNVCLKDRDEYCMSKIQGLDFKSLDPLDPANIVYCSPCLKRYLEIVDDWLENVKPFASKLDGAAALRGRELLDQCPEAMLNAPSDLKLPFIPHLE